MALLKRFSIVMLLLTFISCGGNGGGFNTTTTDPDSDNGTDSATTLALFQSDDQVSAQAPITITALVKRDDSPVAGEIVTFSTDLGSLSPKSGTALTNESGIASITLTAGDKRGAGTVTASLSSDIQQTINFETQGDDVGVVGDINITLELLDASGNATDSITPSKAGKVRATVNGISKPVIVTFAGTVGEMPIPTSITNDANQALVDIYAGNNLGAGKITATLDSGEFGELLLVVGSSSLTMGSGSPYVENIAEVAIAPNSLSAGATTTVTVEIRDDEDNLYTEPVEVNFTSPCAGEDKAVIDSLVSTSNGIATSTYRAQGCEGDDAINVTANAGGINLSASATINVLKADIGSIEFISAVPEYVGIVGTGAVGGSESSTLVFKVKDKNGDPVAGNEVSFSLNTDVGGLSISPEKATSDTNGLVQTVVNAGTVATSVRVTAQMATGDPTNPYIYSQSSKLVVSTGIPDQDSFSLSADTLNIEGWQIDGAEVQITARLADHFNNPPPDGTVVYFTTEGGRIEDSCQTVNGTCLVTWNSQNPRPLDGRVTVLAHAIGEESFADLNGNGRFDAGDEVAAFKGTAPYDGKDVGGYFFDLTEAFVDYNEDGVFTPSGAAPLFPPTGSGLAEWPIPFINDGVFNDKDGLYNGVLCAIPEHPDCSIDQKSIHIRQSLVIVKSGSTANITINATNDAVTAGSAEDQPNDEVLNVKGSSAGSVVFTIADLHNQQMPAGSVITVTSTVGSVITGASQVWPSSNDNSGRQFSASVKGDKEADSGSIIISCTTPSGTVTEKIIDFNILP